MSEEIKIVEDCEKFRCEKFRINGLYHLLISKNCCIFCAELTGKQHKNIMRGYSEDGISVEESM